MVRFRRRLAFLLIFAALAGTPPALAQFMRDHESEGGVRSFHGPGSLGKITRSFQSDAEARIEFERILSTVGLAWITDRITLRASSQTSNAEAAIGKNGERFIFYNALFMQKVREKTAEHWSLVSILAHEVGHHLAFHTEIAGRFHEFELEADYFSGFVLRRLGATLDQAHVAMRLISPKEATATHPGLDDRLQVISVGWTDGGGAGGPRGLKQPAGTPTAVVVPQPVPKPPAPACAGVEVAIATSGERRCIQPGSGQSFRDCPDCPEMVVVPAGSFTMGSPASEPEREGFRQGTESPQLKVEIARSFAVGKFSVTRGEFASFVTATGHQSDGGCYAYTGTEWTQQADHSWRSPGFPQNDRHPVTCVNWEDAKAYATWLSSKTGKTYRLLSEAEREYVTRAGKTTPFWWGSSISPTEANYNGNFTYAGGGSKGEYRRGTVSVDMFAPNPWGLYNVHGNLWEWMVDCWNDSHSGNPGNGSARTAGDCMRRVVRGGSWINDPRALRAAYRFGDIAAGRYYVRGFRLARTFGP